MKQLALKIMLLIACFIIMLPSLPTQTVKGEAESIGERKSAAKQQALNWLKKQFDTEAQPTEVAFNQSYLDEYVGNVSGTVMMNTLPYTEEMEPYVSISETYKRGYEGTVKGQWGGLSPGEINSYSIAIFDKTDIGHKITAASLDENGTWETSGTVAFHGEPIIALMQGDQQIISYAKSASKKKIKEYEVWIYSITDIPYLQTKVPIYADGTFSTQDSVEFLGIDLSRFFPPVRKGQKVAKVVRVHDGQVVGTTDNPAFPLIRSYDVPMNDPLYAIGLHKRSWIYDDALAVIAFALGDDRKRASTILNTLQRVQKPDGSLNMSYDTYVGETSPMIRSGSLAWVGYSTLVYEERLKDPKYRQFAVNIAEYLLSLQNKQTGSIRGGPEVKWYSTEHNIDSYFFMRKLGTLTGDLRYITAAEEIEDALLTYHWNADEQRFNQGINDPAGALDTNSWGGIFLGAIGRKDLQLSAMHYLAKFKVDDAEMVLNKNRNRFNMTYQASSSISGYKPYLDDESYPGAPSIVWTEGTWGVINLFMRESVNTDNLLQSMFTLQDADPNGGLVYTNEGYAPEPYEFHAWPSVAATAWQFITLFDPHIIWEYE